MNLSTLFGDSHSRQFVIGSAALLALVLSGVGGVMAWSPVSGEVTSPDVITSSSQAPLVTDIPGNPKCPECGFIESSRMIVRERQVFGTDRENVSKEAPVTSFGMSEVTVRMNDGTNRQFVDANPSNWRPGERMIFIEGVSASAP